jgi:putative ABC transport system permease protein
MFRNYLLSAWRSLIKSKFFSLLNILGLSVGLAAALLIFQYVGFQLSYDTQHENGENIYRITYSKVKEGEEVFNTVLVYAGVGSLMKQTFPEVEDYCRMRPLQMANPKGPVRFEDKAFEEDGVYWVDQNFFTFFSYPLIIGDPATVLKDQFTAVVSESMAKKYFGDEDPIGQTLRVGQKAEVTVTGVFKDIPANSHMKFGILVSHSTMKPLMPPWWNEDNLQLFHGHLYVSLKPGSSPTALAAKFPKFVDDFINGEELRKTGVELKYAIMPLRDIHLNSHIQHESEVNGDIKIVKYMILIGMVILFIAWINYVNLSTSRALERAKEVGVRKVIGAFKYHLILQFLFEAILINIVSCAIAVGMAWVAQPVFDQLGAGGVRQFNLFENEQYIYGAIVVFLCGVLLSGFYPAFVLSSFEPVTVLKGKFTNSKYGVALRKSLVVLQFVASIVLLIGTATIYKQIDFLQHSELGFDIKQNLVVKAPLVIDSTFTNKSLAFKRELANIASIKGVAASYSVPSMEPGGAGWFYRIGDSPDNVQFCYHTWVDENFVPDMKFTLLEGRNFSLESKADSSAAIVNEACLPLFGFKEPKDAVGAKISGGGEEYTIIGVVKNFQQKSLKTEYTPIIINFQPGVKGYYNVRLEGKDGQSVRSTIAAIGDVWREFFPENPYIFFFLDEEFNKQYQADMQFGRLFSFFSLIAIFIGCLGLFGLSSFMVAKRTKEIGIRKVLGSSVGQLFVLLSREFIILITIANACAWPIVLYVMDAWLNTFAYRISIGIGIFILSAVIIFIIAFITIGYQVAKASLSNPIHALRTE